MRFNFFATEKEIKECFLEVEKERPLKYVVMKNYKKPELIVYNTIEEIPNVGISKSGNTMEIFLTIFDQNCDVMIDHREGSPVYEVSDTENQSAIYVYFGGLYEDKCLVWNTIVTMKNANDEGKALMRTIIKRFKKISSKPVPGCYLSKGSEELYWNSNGKLRLTSLGYDSPDEYDLKLDKVSKETNS